MQTKESLKAKTRQNFERQDPAKQNTENGKILGLKTKLIYIALIGINIGLTVSVVILAVMHIKYKKDHKMEISDLELEKSVLENQKLKLNETIKNLTILNSNLNLTNKNLNDKIAIALNEEIKKNKTYKALEDISKEGKSLKETFATISKNLEKIKITDESNLQTNRRMLEENANRELAESLNALQGQLELIKALMDQISINLDLVNQNKELLLNNINITNQLNQQIINNTALLLENQKLIKEKVELNNEIDESEEANNELKKKVEKLENELEDAKNKLNQTCTNQNDDEKEKIEELNKKINEEISKNTALKDQIMELKYQFNRQIKILKIVLVKKKILKNKKQI